MFSVNFVLYSVVNELTEYGVNLEYVTLYLKLLFMSFNPWHGVITSEMGSFCNYNLIFRQLH